MFCFMLKEITTKELLKKTNIQLIDVREPYEYEEGHIENSINIPMDNVLKSLDKLDHSKQSIILYCRTGRRSASVTYMLNKLHKISVYNLKGGYKNFSKVIAK